MVIRISLLVLGFAVALFLTINWRAVIFLSMIFLVEAPVATVSGFIVAFGICVMALYLIAIRKRKQA
jgi:hypothetical protein